MCVYVCMHACVDVGFGWGMNGGFGWGCEGGLNFRLLSIQILYFFFPFNKFSPSISSYEYSLDVIYFLYPELEDISWRRKAEGKNLSSEIIFGRKPYYHDINREV